MLDTNHLTFTRFLAALWVVLYHFFSNTSPFDSGYLHAFIVNGNLGVSYFYVLSGFVLTLAYKNNTFDKIQKKQFFINRFARIYPMFLISVLASIVVSFFLGIYFSFGEILANILVLTAFVLPYSASLFGLGWSITTEFVFYGIFPSIINKYRSHLNNFMVLASIVWLLTQLFSNFLLHLNGSVQSAFLHDFAYHSPIWHINQFLIGIVFGQLYFKLYEKHRRDNSIVVLLLIGFLLYCLKLLPNTLADYSYLPFLISPHNGLIAPIFGAIILLIALDNGIIYRLFNLNLLKILGEASYSMYLIQNVVWGIFSLTIHKFFTFQTERFAYLLLLIFSSIITYTFIEKPSQKLIKSRIKP